MVRREPWSLEHSEWLGMNCQFTQAGVAFELGPPLQAGNVVQEITVYADGYPAGFAAYQCPKPPPWPRSDTEWVASQYEKRKGAEGFTCRPARAPTRQSTAEIIKSGAGKSFGPDDFILFETHFIAVTTNAPIKMHHHRESTSAERARGIQEEVIPPGTKVSWGPDEATMTSLQHAGCAISDPCLAHVLTASPRLGTTVRCAAKGSQNSRTGLTEIRLEEITVVDAGGAELVERELGITSP